MTLQGQTVGSITCVQDIAGNFPSAVDHFIITAPITAGNTVILLVTADNTDRYAVAQDPEFIETRGFISGNVAAHAYRWVDHPGGQTSFAVKVTRTAGTPNSQPLEYRIFELNGVAFNSEGTTNTGSDEPNARKHDDTGLTTADNCFLCGVNTSHRTVSNVTPNPEYDYARPVKFFYHAQMFAGGRTADQIPFTIGDNNPGKESGAMLAFDADAAPPGPTEDPMLFQAF